MGIPAAPPSVVSDKPPAVLGKAPIPNDAHPRDLRILVGLTAVLFSVLYFVSDVIELTQGRFSTGQLILTLVAEAAIPIFVVGLYLIQRPKIGSLGRAGALAYAYSFVFFTSTVVYALVNETASWEALSDEIGVWMTAHGLLMLVAGVAFGAAIIRARVLPAWTGITLISGVILIVASARLPDIAQTASAGVRDLAFAGMGAALLFTRRQRR